MRDTSIFRGAKGGLIFVLLSAAACGLLHAAGRMTGLIPEVVGFGGLIFKEGSASLLYAGIYAAGCMIIMASGVRDFPFWKLCAAAALPLAAFSAARYALIAGYRAVLIIGSVFCVLAPLAGALAQIVQIIRDGDLYDDDDDCWDRDLEIRSVVREAVHLEMPRGVLMFLVSTVVMTSVIPGCMEIITEKEAELLETVLPEKRLFAGSGSEDLFIANARGLRAFREDVWPSLSEAEKLTALQLAADIEAERLMGSGVRVRVSARPTEERLNSYCRGSEVTVSRGVLWDRAKALGAVLHEVKHVHQKRTVEILESAGLMEEPAVAASPAGRWAEEFRDYVSGQQDPLLYMLQDVEEDARQYQQVRTEDYLLFIDQLPEEAGI